MLIFFQFRTVFFILLIVAATACSKKESAQPVPTTGGITGSITPADAVSTITLTSNLNVDYTATPTTTGTFSLDNLPAGSYTMNFTPTQYYTKPASQTVTITAGAVKSVGVITLASNGFIRGGTVSWTANGQAYTTSTRVTGIIAQSTPASKQLNLSVTSDPVNGNVDGFSMRIDDFDLNPYNYGLTIGQNGVYYQYQLNLGSNGLGLKTYWVSNFNRGTGSVTVTGYNSATRTLTGIFSFSAPPFNGTTGPNLVVTNGTFSLNL